MLCAIWSVVDNLKIIVKSPMKIKSHLREKIFVSELYTKVIEHAYAYILYFFNVKI